MAHGQPDFGPQAVKETVSSLADMAELAVRLGSIVTFDRKGDVFWFDDFEDGIEKWVSELTGDRGSVTWDAEHAQKGAFSAKLATGNVTGDKVRFERDFPFPVVSKLGCEISFTSPLYLDYLALELHLYDGAKLHKACVKWISADHRWQYFGKDNEWHDLEPTLYLWTVNYIFHTIKLVADFTTGYLAHLIVNNTVFDLSSYEYRKSTSYISPYLIVYFDIVTDRAEEIASHVDHVIITQNEP